MIKAGGSGYLNKETASEELTAANGMLTQTQKPKRRAIMEKYGHDLHALYPKSESQRPAPRASYIRELSTASSSSKVATGA